MSQQINLFNPIFLKQKKYFSAVAMLQALGLILLGCMLLSFYTSHKLSALSNQAEITAAQLSSIQDRLNRMNAAYSPKQKAQSVEEEIRHAEIEVKSLQQVFDILKNGKFSEEGYAEYMRAFARQIIDGVWLTGFTLGGSGSEIELQGGALNPELVPAYLMRLKREPVLQGKSFASLEMQNSTAEEENKAASTGGKEKLSSSYIEFRLQSSGLATGEPKSTGADSK